MSGTLQQRLQRRCSGSECAAVPLGVSSVRKHSSSGGGEAAGFGSERSTQCQSSAEILWVFLFFFFLWVQQECVGELLSELFASVGWRGTCSRRHTRTRPSPEHTFKSTTQFCLLTQTEWEVDSSWGHTTVNMLNSTCLLWLQIQSFRRNQRLEAHRVLFWSGSVHWVEERDYYLTLGWMWIYLNCLASI